MSEDVQIQHRIVHAGWEADDDQYLQYPVDVILSHIVDEDDWTEVQGVGISSKDFALNLTLEQAQTFYAFLGELL